MNRLRAIDAAITATEESLPRLKRLANHRTAVPPCGRKYADLLTEAETRLEALYEQREQLLTEIVTRRFKVANSPARHAPNQVQGFSPL